MKLLPQTCRCLFSVAMSNHHYEALGCSREQFGFRRVELLKAQGLGTGSYGGVCKAKCDGLICAAKIMHPTLFDLRDPGTVSYLGRFEQECHLLGSARHPNIVQYLGTYCDPETHLPVLLMELCDESLSRFLERSPEPLPFYVQLSVAHDISLALSYLHLNALIHRDLSGNNVLMIAGTRAKVTDFGMSKLFLANPRMTPMTLCPGNVQYMSPEALDDPPSYTDKLDVFSFGVLLIQIVTQQFPDPGPRFKVISIPDYPEGSVRVAIPETQRRSSHLEPIPDTHSLKTVAISCLRDKEAERPSAQELSETLSELKQSPQYAESVHSVGDNKEGGRGTGEGSKEVENHREQIEVQRKQLAVKEEELSQLQEEMGEKEREIAQLRTERGRLETQLQEAGERLRNQGEGTGPGHSPAHEPDGKDGDVTATEALTDGPNIAWKEEKNAPEEMFRGSAVAQGDTVFFSPHNSKKIYVCKMFQHGQSWSKLPDNTVFNASLAILSDLLVSVGGQGLFDCTDSVHSLTRKGLRERKVFPSMPTPRCDAVSATTEHFLIVVGGYDGSRYLDVVEVMEISTERWGTACSLPLRFGEMSATICGGVLYVGGGYNGCGDSSKSVLGASLSGLLSYQAGKLQRSVWKEIEELPLTLSSLVTLGGRLLAIGGVDDSESDSTSVYCYDDARCVWSPVSRLLNPRNKCLVGVVPGDRVLVVGGWRSLSVEIGSLRHLLGVPEAMCSTYDDIPPLLRCNLSQSSTGAERNDH